MKKNFLVAALNAGIILLSTSLFAQNAEEGKAPGYFKPSIGFGYRIAGVAESIKQFPGLEALSKKQRSGIVLGAEAGFFINKQKSESIGLLYQRFGSKATGPVSLPGLQGNFDFTTDENISLLALVYNTHLKFSKNGSSGVTFKVGAGYNHYNGTASALGNATAQKISKGGLGYLLGADLDFGLSKNIFFTTGLSFSAGNVRVEEGDDGKENLSMIIGGIGLKFVW